MTSRMTQPPALVPLLVQLGFLTFLDALDHQAAVCTGILCQDGEPLGRSSAGDLAGDFTRRANVEVGGIRLDFVQNVPWSTQGASHDPHIGEQKGVALFVIWERQSKHGLHRCVGQVGVEKADEFNQGPGGRPEVWKWPVLGEQRVGHAQENCHEDATRAVAKDAGIHVGFDLLAILIELSSIVGPLTNVCNAGFRQSEKCLIVATHGEVAESG